MKLWQTTENLDPFIERFTTGRDPELDMLLLPYDCEASVAHVKMLAKISLITADEMEQLVAGLNKIKELHLAGHFSIETKDEDGHTAIEKFLTATLGEAGKRVHTGRSRNDQVLTAMRLFEKDHLLRLTEMIHNLLSAFEDVSDRDGHHPLPGYTHTRKAMPFSVRQWLESFCETLRDDLVLMEATMKVIDKNPLGTGAGYGVPVELDREMTTNLLGFDRILDNPLAAQNGRGKLESRILHDCLMVLGDLNRWASDVILFTMPEVGYFDLSDTVTTGSSIMPHKRNPDLLELIRAAFGVVSGYELQCRMIPANLISGYHRDLQWTKEPVIRGLTLTIEVVQASVIAASSLKANPEELNRAMTPELLSVRDVMELVAKGVPFREAYRRISNRYK